MRLGRQHDDEGRGALENSAPEGDQRITLGPGVQPPLSAGRLVAGGGGGRHSCFLVQLPSRFDPLGACGTAFAGLAGQRRGPARIGHAEVMRAFSGNLRDQGTPRPVRRGATRGSRRRTPRPRRSWLQRLGPPRPGRQPPATDRGHRPPDRGTRPPDRRPFGRHAPSAGLARTRPATCCEMALLITVC